MISQKFSLKISVIYRILMKNHAILKTLIRKLVYLNKWGNSHTSFDNLPKGFPGHLKGEVKKIAKDLIKRNILLAKPTAYGLEVSLNPNKKAEIEKIFKNS